MASVEGRRDPLRPPAPAKLGCQPGCQARTNRTPRSGIAAYEIEAPVGGSSSTRFCRAAPWRQPRARTSSARRDSRETCRARPLRRRGRDRRSERSFRRVRLGQRCTAARPRHTSRAVDGSLGAATQPNRAIGFEPRQLAIVVNEDRAGRGATRVRERHTGRALDRLERYVHRRETRTCWLTVAPISHAAAPRRVASGGLMDEQEQGKDDTERRGPAPPS